MSRLTWMHRVARPGLAVIVGIAAGTIALGLIPPAHKTTGPVTLSAGARLGGGVTSLDLPPFGAVSARTHASPLELRVRLARVDFEQLAPLAGNPVARGRLQRALESDLQELAIAGALRSTLGAGLIAALVAAALFRRRVRAALIAAGTAIVTSLTLWGTTALAYDVEAFDEPRFSGSLTRAQEVLDALRRGDELFDEARSRFEIASRRVSDLISVLAAEDVHVSDDATVILHVSDIHGNPLGLEITQELASEFQVDAVIDSGDMFSSFLDTGELSRLTAPLDREMRAGVEDVRAPYYFVPGNHDAPGLLNELTRADNLTILRSDTVEIGGLLVMGWADPTFSEEPVPIEEKDAERLEVGERDVAPAVVETQPDVLVVHDERLGLASTGDVSLILAGHSHRRGAKAIEGTTILTVGSTGATGLKSLTVEADLSYEAQILYFSEGLLASVDYVTLRGLGGDFQLERTTLNGADPEE